MVTSRDEPKREALGQPAPTKPRSTTAARQPLRERGIRRFQALLAATETLLETNDPDAIGLYQIAEHANAPPASVYHFFPSKEAAFLALSESYNERMKTCLEQPIDARELSSWQNLMEIDIRRCIDFHNKHVPMMKLSYFGFSGVGSKQIDDKFSSHLASSHHPRLRKIFQMPELRNAQKIFEMHFAIVDSIWGLSFRKHGKITEYYAQESHNACVAFHLQFLPQRVEPTEALAKAQAAGRKISLPISQTARET